MERCKVIVDKWRERRGKDQCGVKWKGTAPPVLLSFLPTRTGIVLRMSPQEELVLFPFWAPIQTNQPISIPPNGPFDRLS